MAKMRQNSESSPIPDIAAQVRLWRRHLNFKQSDLEVKAGLSHNALSRIETGAVSPRLETLEGLAGAMGISIEELQFRKPVSAPAGEFPADIRPLLDDLERLPDDIRSELLSAFRTMVDLVKRSW
jgi:transcriptional regulator with XRE-family HTH domain